MLAVLAKSATVGMYSNIEGAALITMHIKEFWNQLSPETQQWLIDNPGSMIIPRTQTAILNTETGEDSPVDGHGGTLLTEEDRDFIRAQARRIEPK